jgi:hypothetical protein
VSGEPLSNIDEARGYIEAQIQRYKNLKAWSEADGTVQSFKNRLQPDETPIIECLRQHIAVMAALTFTREEVGGHLEAIDLKQEEIHQIKEAIEQKGDAGATVLLSIYCAIATSLVYNSKF